MRHGASTQGGLGWALLGLVGGGPGLGGSWLVGLGLRHWAALLGWVAGSGWAVL